MNKIAIIEDDIDICNMIAKFLENNKYIVHYALNGAEGIELCKSLVPDLIILDIMLPKLNGNDVLQRLRKFTNAPVIVVSAKTMVQTKIDLLKLGADDYMTKPFSPRELLARVKAVLRRSAKDPQAEGELVVGPLKINFNNYEIFLGITKLELTPKEYELLKLFMTNIGKAYSREQLLEKIWGYDYYGDTRTVDVHIRHLRVKLEGEPKVAEAIETVRGIGYRLRQL